MGSTTPPKDPDGAAFGFKDVVDFNGDVILQVGQEGHGKSLQVSSKVLNLASPVFAAMLNSTFVEGTVPADGQPRIISLPEDDGEAVTTLCLILHLQSHRVHMREFDHFERLAIVCDKYDCARALRPWSTLWLQKWCGSPGGEDDYWRMLYISYAYDDRAAFFVASRAILKHYTEDVIAFAYDIRPELAILPEGILSSGPMYSELRRLILTLLRWSSRAETQHCRNDTSAN
ncbi:MAG: hypothetical protein M1830_010268 [Pleopsidium flavum]|nr:MAG: hypothetical protein M1830_010268 [Pleopsidium flavum]